MTNNAGPLIVDLKNTELDAEEKEILLHPLVGGVILFTRNYSSRHQLKILCQSIRAIRKNLLIMVDQEGGRVQRFTGEFTRLPSLSQFGKKYDEHPLHALQLAKCCGWLMAKELLNVGIDLSLAPVVDLKTDESAVIGERAFHASPQIVTQLARAFIDGQKSAGMSSILKHFPGHGHVIEDSHVELPIDHRPFNEIKKTDLIPFIELIKLPTPAIMTAHIIFSQIDPHPVSYARFWLQDILRKQFNFKGLIFSDDLNMQGAYTPGNNVDRFIAAQRAGCDMILFCNNRPAIQQILEEAHDADYFLSQDKIDRLMANPLDFEEDLHENPDWRKNREFLQSAMNR